MQNFLFVRVLDGPGCLAQKSGRDLRREWSVAEAVLERAIGQQLHREEVLVLGCVEMEDADDVWMLQPGTGAGLGQKSFDVGRVGIAARVNHLEGNFLAGLQVVGVPHDPHAPLTKPADQLVTR